MRQRRNITEVLTNILQSIDIPGGSNSLSGLLDDDVQYKSEYGHSFDRLAVPLPANDKIIAADESNAVRVKDKRLYAAKLEWQKFIKAVEHISRLFS